MADTTTVETRHDRRALAREAGLGPISLGSAVAGMTTAFGTFLLVSATVGGGLALAGVDPDNFANDWRQVGIGGAVFLGVTLFLGYLFGGYVTGRMARRAGMRNGLLMVVCSLLVAGGVGALVGFGADTGRFVDDIRSLGVPTTWSEWSAIASIGGAASLAGMVIGALVGGALGERWHGALLSKAGRLPATIDLRDRDRRRDDDTTGIDLGEGEVHTHADGTMHAHDTAEHPTTGEMPTRATLIGSPSGTSNSSNGTR